MKEYFKIVKDKITVSDFKILVITSKPEENISVFTESIHHIIWAWCNTHSNDQAKMFDYVIIPNNTYFDFENVSNENLLEFLLSEKSKEVDTINIKNIPLL